MKLGNTHALAHTYQAVQASRSSPVAWAREQNLPDQLIKLNQVRHAVLAQKGFSANSRKSPIPTGRMESVQFNPCP